MLTEATHKNARISARKARLYRPILRGLPATAAEQQLKFMPGKAPRLMLTVLQSAMANATNNFGADIAGVTVYDVVVNSGFIFKRHQPASRGMAHEIKKKTAHITVQLDMGDIEKNTTKKRKRRAVAPKRPKAEKEAKEVMKDDTVATQDVDRSAHARHDKEAFAVREKMKMMQQGGDKGKSQRRRSLKNK